jgi:twinkle protein
MSRWYHAPCPKCSSSDAFSYKDDDTYGFCFSCNKSSHVNPLVVASTYSKENYLMHTLQEIENYDTRGFQERGITKTVAAYYGVKVSYAEDGTISSHFYPYTKDGVTVAYKERQLPKKFVIHGEFKGIQLFGQNTATGGKRIVITEGELDALAVAQAQYNHYKRFYPTVAVPSASSKSLILEQREWLRSFDEVILCFDTDEAGQKAAQEAAKIIGYDKVKLCSLPEKDACDVLIKHSADTLMKCIWDAKSHSPADVVKGEAIWEQYKRVKATESLPYPKCLEGINEKLKGMRLGEIVLFTSGTGSGKSTVIKETVLEILNRTDSMVGMVSLEESVGDTAQKFIGMQLQRNISREDVSEEEQYEAFTKVFGDERLVLLDHQGSVSDESLIDKMEHLALMGCKYIILDHITLATSEGVEGKTGNEAVDAFMSDLLKITKKHNIWMGVVSHLRKTGSGQTAYEAGALPNLDAIKGSGSIKQVSFDIIAFARNMTADTPEERNTIKLAVLKSRFTGDTGPAGNVCYNPTTGRLYRPSTVDFE